MGLVKNFSTALVTAGFVVLAVAAQAKASLTLEYEGDIGRPANLAEGEFPGTNGTLAVPQGIGVQDSTGNIYVSNGRGIDRVEIYSPQGEYLGGIGGTNSEPGQGFDEPADLKFDPVTGELHVGDVYNSEIDVYDSQGNYIRSYGSFGGPVEGRSFFGPGGLSFGKDGNVYATDFSSDVIKVYDGKNGELVRTIGSSGSELGQLQGPAGITVSPNTGNIYVADQYNYRVQVFDPQGNALYSFGTRGSEAGQFREPIGLEVDEYENIYVADSQNSRVQVFDKNGNFITEYGTAANAAPPASDGTSPYGDPLDLTPGTFNWTAGLHYDDDKLYVGDFFQGRVQVLNVVRDGATKVPEPAPVFGLGLLGFGVVATQLRKTRQQKSAISLKG
ncbi:scytonemin biosynthesis PEP-CTERM protein ScyF [Mastigocladopsis repens]|uniref:scytonemin biosynthesis PEP-CTERM protein ScyF n=1 Tax=Mastigocladopsis repens TaxID=221287 RepID=UPI0002E6536E|nr:scytonemin biosynthesis PEP-CTERM protein ScyF [Mastigocladopsis repens]